MKHTQLSKPVKKPLIPIKGWLMAIRYKLGLTLVPQIVMTEQQAATFGSKLIHSKPGDLVRIEKGEGKDALLIFEIRK